MVINPIVGVYIPIIRIPIKGWMTIPNTRSLDPGSYYPPVDLLVLSGDFHLIPRSKGKKLTSPLPQNFQTSNPGE